MLDQSEPTPWAPHCSPTVHSLRRQASRPGGWVRQACPGLGADLWLARGTQSQHLTSELNPLNLMDLSCGFCLSAMSNSWRITRHSRNGVRAGLSPTRPHSPAVGHRWELAERWEGVVSGPSAYFTDRKMEAKRG